jgi:PDDEXK-like uncharacterized protein DUF3799
MIKPGIYYDLSSQDYHADTNSISRTSLMEFKKSPRKYWAKYRNPERPIEEPKPAWKFGTAFHTLILEPDLFEKNYFIMPKKVLLKDVGREEYDKYKEIEKNAENTSKIVLSWNDHESLLAMQDSLFNNEKAQRLLEGGIYESSYFWEDEHSGLILKARPDILHPNIYIDLKTIDDASPQNFQREMVKYGYHIQAAMTKDAIKILTGEEIKACINICVEKTYPYSVAIYIIDELAIEAGHMEYKQLCLNMKSCIINNEFGDYEIQEIGLPSWYK